MDRVALVSPADQKSTISSSSSSLLFRSRGGSSKRHRPLSSQPLLSPSSSASSMPHSSSSSRGPTRVARLASIFSSRATVDSTNKKPASEPKPLLKSKPRQKPPSSLQASPSRESDASSSYIAWPGTQDKRGGTVAIQSSFDSSEGGGGYKRVNYEENLERAAQFEVKKWMKEQPSKKLTPLERRIVHGVPQQEEEEEEEEEEENPADFHLAAVLANAAAAANSPLASSSSSFKRVAPSPSNSKTPTRAQSEANTGSYRSNRYSSFKGSSARSSAGRSMVSSTASTAISIQDLFVGKQQPKSLYKSDPWDVDSSSQSASQPPSSPATSVSRDSSSLYLYKNGSVQIPGIDERLSNSVVRQKTSPITAETLAAIETRLPARRALNANNVRGYRGFLNKTRDVPNLMDAVDSDSMASSSRATSTFSSEYYKQLQKKESDVFDNIHKKESDVFDNIDEHTIGARPQSPLEKEDELNVVVLPSGLASIQSPQDAYDKRHTSTEFDDALTNSEVDQYGFIKLPEKQLLQSRFMLQNESSSSSSSSPSPSTTDSETSSGSFLYPSTSRYVIDGRAVKKLVRKYRKLSHEDEDAKRAFALHEMRSRIMEKDIDRGLERRGGTVVCDDLISTQYHQKALRVRDAVIVSKAWRDGASPRDAVVASQLLLDQQMRWMDDTDFMQFRCPSLGPRCMRGFEMFTIGDCQSILLKLTNERCMQLRLELNDATARQIEAEEIMRDEESDTGMDHGMMTEAEMTYLTSMEEVKALSKQLVVAERAFHLVRDRIEQLVAKYETLLVRIENESVAASSVITFDSSYYSDESSLYDTEEDREKEQLARRAQRAEIKAELAAREAAMAKQEAKKNIEEKQRELEELQLRLSELQSEPSHAIPEREHSVILAKAIAANSGRSPASDAQEAHERVVQGSYQEKIDGVKQKFRDRMAERKRASSSSSRRNVLSGEEMFQYLDFYERSLKSVENQRVGVQ